MSVEFAGFCSGSSLHLSGCDGPLKGKGDLCTNVVILVFGCGIVDVGDVVECFGVVAFVFGGDGVGVNAFDGFLRGRFSQFLSDKGVKELSLAGLIGTGPFFGGQPAI